MIRAESAEGTVAKVIRELHFNPVREIKFCALLDLVVSTDDCGIVEIWDPETYEFPEDEGRLKFQLLSDTDFIELVKARTCVVSMAFSTAGDLLAMLGKDRVIRVFRLADGKLLLTLDETLQTYTEEQANIKGKSDMLYLDKLDFERRLLVERELDKQWEYSAREHTNLHSNTPTLGFDETDSYLYFGSLLGIKVVSVKTGELVRVIGKVESTERFLNIALFQGKPQRLAASSGLVGAGGKTS